jgi:hypothetical protein
MLCNLYKIIILIDFFIIIKGIGLNRGEQFNLKTLIFLQTKIFLLASI